MRSKPYEASLCATFFTLLFFFSFLAGNSLFSTIHVFSSPNVRDQVPRALKTTRKITVLYAWYLFRLIAHKRTEDCELNDVKQALWKPNLPLIPTWIKFWFTTAHPKYLNLATFSNNLLAVFIVFCPAFGRSNSYIRHPDLRLLELLWFSSWYLCYFPIN
jgi:hypothetical protein